MKRKKVLEMITRYLLCVVVAIICVGCPQEQHSNAAAGNSDENSDNRAYNLGRISCSSTHATIEIEVNGLPGVLADQDNLVIFTCPADTVRWYTKDKNLRVTVALEGEKAEELFKSKRTLLVSDATTGTTTTETVLKAGKRGTVHKYSIWVAVPGQDPPNHIDPHVIPM
jgi:hypothetical protein